MKPVTDAGQRCAVEVGIHPAPYWRDGDSAFVVCDRHRGQYDERPDLGPFDWRADCCPSCASDEPRRVFEQCDPDNGGLFPHEWHRDGRAGASRG